MPAEWQKERFRRLRKVCWFTARSHWYDVEKLRRFIVYTLLCYNRSHGGFHKWGYPIAGWCIRGYRYFRKPPHRHRRVYHPKKVSRSDTSLKEQRRQYDRWAITHGCPLLVSWFGNLLIYLLISWSINNTPHITWVSKIGHPNHVASIRRTIANQWMQWVSPTDPGPSPQSSGAASKSG